MSLRSIQELQEPEEVFTNFFENFHMEEALLQLREARDIVLKKKFRFSKDAIEKDNIIFFFEKMEKVIEAGYLLRN